MMVSSLSALLLLPAIVAAFRPKFLWRGATGSRAQGSRAAAA